ncbi:MAG: DUF1360 domain-containing protein [Pseudonocardiaceae bacterium]
MDAQAPPGPAQRAPDPFGGYSDEDQPLAGRVTLVSAFGASVGVAALAARITGREPPERPHPADVVMVGMATHKLSRLLTKSKATSFLRAPFTELEAPRGTGEVDERPRGRGVRRAVGELVVCPYCLSQWIAAGFTAGLVLAPRATRLVAASYSAQTLADFLQLAYRACGQRA